MWPSDVRPVERTTGSSHRRGASHDPADRQASGQAWRRSARPKRSEHDRPPARGAAKCGARSGDAALIAEAIAAGKVRHIPRGISGLPEFAPSAEPMEPET